MTIDTETIDTAPNATRASDMLPALLDDFGVFADGYTPNDIDAVLPRWERLLGVKLMCRWARNTGPANCGGDSEILVNMGHLGRHRAADLPEGIMDYLLGIPADDALIDDRASRVDRAFLLGTLVERARHQPVFPTLMNTAWVQRTVYNYSPK